MEQTQLPLWESVRFESVLFSIKNAEYSFHHAFLLLQPQQSPPNLSLAIPLNISIVLFSFSLNPANFSSLSALRALMISSRLISRSFFFRSLCAFIRLSSSPPSEPMTSASRKSTSPDSCFEAAKERLESLARRLFSRARSRVPASERGVRSSRRDVWSLRSDLRCCLRRSSCSSRARVASSSACSWWA
jgi:hypothetical protein